MDGLCPICGGVFSTYSARRIPRSYCSESCRLVSQKWRARLRRALQRAEAISDPIARSRRVALVYADIEVYKKKVGFNGCVA